MDCSGYGRENSNTYIYIDKRDSVSVNGGETQGLCTVVRHLVMLVCRCCCGDNNGAAAATAIADESRRDVGSREAATAKAICLASRFSSSALACTGSIL